MPASPGALGGGGGGGGGGGTGWGVNVGLSVLWVGAEGTAAAAAVAVAGPKPFKSCSLFPSLSNVNVLHPLLELGFLVMRGVPPVAFGVPGMRDGSNDTLAFFIATSSLVLTFP